jgi:hypothetical protein
MLFEDGAFTVPLITDGSKYLSISSFVIKSFYLLPSFPQGGNDCAQLLPL